MLDQYELLLSRSVERHRGTVVKHSGNGALATFTSTTMALQAASDLLNIARELGLQARTGLHVGEVEIRGKDIGGIAVHLAARVMSQAGPDEVVASSAAVDSSSAGVGAVMGVAGRPPWCAAPVEASRELLTL